MTGKERVRAVLSHSVPDRPPIVVGVSNATGIKMGTYQRLKKLTGITEPDRYLYDFAELGTALPGEQMLQRLHTDVRGVHDRMPDWVMQRGRDREPGSPFFDDWGIGTKQIRPGEWYPGVHPLAAATTIEELEAYDHWPDMSDPTRLAGVGEHAQALAAAGEYAVMATPWLLFPLERAFGLQGMDAFLLNLAMNPEFAVALLRKNLELCKDLMGRFLAEVGECIDIIKIGDDLGTQESLLMSPAMYRELVAPIHAEFISFIKERTNAAVFFHTDGDVFDLIPDLITMGVEILNPIQTSAGRMSDLQRLKDTYGQELVFCGAVDTQELLPNGTPEEVTREVRRVTSILGSGGGYMVASVHTIMNDVPPENVLAMVDAV